MTTGPVNQPRQPTRRFGVTDVVMLTILLVTLAVVFLFGVYLLTVDARFASSDIVAILAPVLGVIGTVAAGIFGYSLSSTRFIRGRMPGSLEMVQDSLSKVHFSRFFPLSR